MGVVRNVKRQAWYLSKYLSKEDFERYYFSGGWVFPDWIGFSRWIRKEFGVYPRRGILANLARIGSVGREEDTWFGLYLWVKEGSRG